MKDNKNHLLLIAVAVLVVAVVVIAVARKSSTVASVPTTYAEGDFDFEVTYPKPQWYLSDELTTKKCCLFIASWTYSTSTVMSASSTPQERVTARENIKLQIGNYETKTYDPFAAASTTKVTLGGTDFYRGVDKSGLEFYILPRNKDEGIGIAVFAYRETTDEDRRQAKDVISSIKLLPRGSVKAAEVAAKSAEKAAVVASTTAKTVK